MHALPRCPPKPKQPNRNAEATHHSTVQPMFRMDLPSPFADRLPMQSHIDNPVAEDIGGDGEADANANRDEYKAILVDAEVVDFSECVWYGSKEHKEHGEGERGIQRYECHERLEEKHVHWSDQGYSGDDLLRTCQYT